MKEILPVIGYISLALIFGIVVSYLRDRNTRKLKANVLQQVQSIEHVNIRELKATRKSVALLGFSIEWDRADVIFIENLLIYFSYVQVFNFQVYKSTKQFGVKDKIYPNLLPKHFLRLIDTAELKKQDLVITSFQGGGLFKVKRTLILQGVGHSDKLDVIKDMLKVN